MTSLDHVGIIVPDLDAAAELFGRLGFTLTRRADHTRAGPDGRVEPAGSAQCSIMLEQGYVELQQITDPAGGHILSPAAAKYSGLHIVAFGVDDPESAQLAARARGLDAGPVLRWGRAMAEPDLLGEARFAFFVLPYEAEDESYFCWVRPLTPELLRSPRLTHHVNGARTLSGLTIAGRDEEDVTRIAGRLLAAGAQSGPRTGGALEAGSRVLTLGEASILVAPPEALGAVARARVDGRSGRVVGMGMTADDPDAIAGRARSAGIPVREEERGVSVDFGDDLGLTLTVRRA